MFRSLLLRTLFDVARSRKERRRLAARNRKPVRLMLESLEERLTPSQTAGSYNDLVNAVAADTGSNNSYVIQITQSFQFSSGNQISISNLGSGSTLTIEGQNGTNYTLTGNGNRLFTVAAGQNVVFDNLTLTGGGGVSSGGAIDDQGGNVTLSEVAVRSNKVSGSSADGGGVFVTQNGTLTIQGGSTIQSNHATGTGNVIPSKGVRLGNGNSASGGGLYASGGSTVIIQDSSVGNNTVSANEAFGGGICVLGNSTLTIQGGSTIQSNRASGTGTSSAATGLKFSNFASGSGLYVYGASSVQITDSSIDKNIAQGGRGADGTAAGASGNGGGSARGGGVYVSGSGWNATLIGDTLSGNAAIGGNGGNGAAGSNATGTNVSGGNGGSGGGGGSAGGGAAWFGIAGSLSSGFSGSLTILNNLSNPLTHPSLMIGNTVQGGSGGNGGAGGSSTGTANNANGGDGGIPSGADGGAIYLVAGPGVAANFNIGNSTFYGNQVTGGNGGAGGAAGTGGSGTGGTAGANQTGGGTYGGGLYLQVEGGSVTMVNSTVAKNTAMTGLSSDGGTYGVPGSGGGGISAGDSISILANNTITQNTVSGVANRNGEANLGAGLVAPSLGPTLFNNLIQGNQSVGSSAPDFQLFPGNTTPVSNASNNFIASMSPNAISTTSNIVGNSQTQLGSVVGVDANGNPTGGPIYYPLLANAVSIGAGTTSDLSTIAGVEGTTSADTTDEIGNPRSSNSSIDLGAVQYQPSPAPVVTTNPSNQTMTAGGDVSFTAAASGNPAPTVQWQVSSDGGKTFSNISGAPSTTLTLNNVTTAMNGNEYQAVFTNNTGSATTTAATLTIPTAPSFTSGNSAVFTVGQGGSFLVTATGSPTPTLTVSGALPSGVTFTANGNGTATLTGAPAAGTNGTYSLTITAHNGAGSDTTQSFTLIVNPAPVVTPPAPPSSPPVLQPPLLLRLFDLVFTGIVTDNANDTETVTDSLFGIPLLVSTYDGSGNLMSVTLFGFSVTALFV